MKKSRILASALLLLPIVLCGSLAQGSRGDIAIGMVTGSKNGTYIAFGREIAAVAAKEGLDINVFESNGSVDNINRITSKEKVGLAIVQSDVLSVLERAKNDNAAASFHKLRMVAPLYSEEVHILARRNIVTLDDLNGKRVVVGNENSGSLITAVNIFKLMNITPSKMYEGDPSDPTQGIIRVLHNDVDAVVFVGGKPVKMFKNMEDLAGITKGPNAGIVDQVHFVPIDDARLLKQYKHATLTHNDYSFITQDVPTIAVPAVLITYDYSQKRDVYYEEQCRNMALLGKALRENIGELKANGHPKWKEVDLNAEVGEWKRDTCSEQPETAKKDAPVQHAAAIQGTNLEKTLIETVRGKQ